MQELIEMLHFLRVQLKVLDCDMLANAPQPFLLDLCGRDLTGQEPPESANIRIIEDILKI